MATNKNLRHCTVVLHDDRVTKDSVLCGVDVVPMGWAAYLSAPKIQRICIVAKARAAGQKEISIHVSLARKFGIENRTPGTVTLIEDYDEAVATHLEIFFRDQYLSRADMWRLTRHLEGTAVYKGQDIKYLGSSSATVKAIYIAGREVDSAIVQQPRTKPIIRSGSARYSVMIQVSKEMLEYWQKGELLYESLTEGYLTSLFERWEESKVRHQVSIVLFGRTAAMVTAEGSIFDFFHVVVLDRPSGQWRDILSKLKRDLNDLYLPRHVSLAAEGNLLEAIHMAAMAYTEDRIDLHLASSGASIIAITAGAGLFEAKYNTLKRTTSLLLGNSIGVDIVSLSPKPLHPVPLFHYKLADAWEYALPHWADISYWPPGQNSRYRWLWSFTPEPIADVALPLLPQQKSVRLSSKLEVIMDGLDDDVFRDVNHQDSIDVVLSSEDPGSVAESEGVEENVNSKVHELDAQIARRAPPLKSRPSMSSIGSGLSSVPRAKKEASKHPLLQTGRKISFGPKGLAPLAGVASTTISSAYASHGKALVDPASTISDGGSGGLAKQIRKTLARQPSQQSLLSNTVTDSPLTTQPINIRSTASVASSEDETHESPEATPRDTKGPPKQAVSSAASKTPKAFGTLGLSPILLSKNVGQQAMTPWLTLLNPCNPKRNNMRVASQYRKWQHVFPRAIDSGDFKWTSMCSPAALPLHNDLYPSTEELADFYKKRVRRLVLSPSVNSSANAEKIVERLVAIRLSRGFQLVARRGEMQREKDGFGLHKILLCMGAHYHEVQCLSDLEIQVIEYDYEGPQPTQGERETTYPCIIRPGLSSRATKALVHLDEKPAVSDWANIDQTLAESNDSNDSNSAFQMRFVLLPTDIPRPEGGPNTKGNDLSDEERRLEGIQKLTQLWQRHRFFPEQDNGHLALVTRLKSRPNKGTDEHDPNPLAIEYHTRDPSALINTQEPSLTGQLPDEIGPIPLFAESDMYHSTNFDLLKLLKHMQEEPPRGVEVKDRRWFTRMHLKCFRGDEMTNWLLGAFKDLHTREDAVAMGNELMERSIFTHVRHKHAFRDGNYFYQIASAYRTIEYPDTAGLFARGPGRSIPPTPTVEFRPSPMVRPVRGDSESSGKETPVISAVDRKQILLSQCLTYNVDPSGKSEHEELVNLHYDRIHNPENCYHIRINWLHTTPKLIREAIARWTTLTEAYGLKLVQIPMAEACKQPYLYTFEQPQYVGLALSPPEKAPITPHLGGHAFSPRLIDEPYHYHKIILRRQGFVLDHESKESFTTKLDIIYSWGRPHFTQTQFVHRSGLVLAQILVGSEDDFLLLPNRLAPPRVNALAKHTDGPGAEQIIKSFQGFCHDSKVLRGLYEESARPKTSASTPVTSAALAADQDIPPMQLPPHLLHRALSRHPAAASDV